jgi:hypothetical protein
LVVGVNRYNATFLGLVFTTVLFVVRLVVTRVLFVVRLVVTRVLFVVRLVVPVPLFLLAANGAYQEAPGHGYTEQSCHIAIEHKRRLLFILVTRQKV